jgi:hypothetical protein
MNLIFVVNMKNIFKYTLAILLTVPVFYGGAGVNIVYYCCNQCRSAGIEMLLNDKCCKIHHANHKQAAGQHKRSSCCTEAEHAHPVKTCNHCTTNHASDNCCNMERISFDWYTQHTTGPEMNLSPVVLDLFLSEIPAIAILKFLRSKTGAVMPKGPPFACPHDYLSLLTILLI